MDEGNVTIVDAGLVVSQATGRPAVRLELLPHAPLFLDGRRVSRVFSSFANQWPVPMARALELRKALGMVVSVEPFTDEEMRSMVGRLLRVCVEVVEFRDMLRLRVVGFLPYSGATENLDYSDNEYVFMVRELLRDNCF